MPNHQIPLFLSNDPEQVDEVSDDGSRFTIRLTPPIFVPARRLDGSNVVPTISARSIDIINSIDIHVINNVDNNITNDNNSIIIIVMCIITYYTYIIFLWKCMHARTQSPGV